MEGPLAAFESGVRVMRRLIDNGSMRLFLQAQAVTSETLSIKTEDLEELLTVEGITSVDFQKTRADVRRFFGSAVSGDSVASWLVRNEDKELAEQKVGIIREVLVTERHRENFAIKETSKTGVLARFGYNISVRHESDGRAVSLPFATVELGINQELEPFYSNPDVFVRFDIGIDELEYLMANLQEVRDRLAAIKR